ncbi:DNA gyrase inhibitor YacG [Roseospira navarrensis]|uniref:DNA gyrase inhibitor YacG n=1 Tax=Roseospira navarrensis TaxID=140058 RepID=A0A7X2D4T2_9PROT|nr:DNA gyrase inhibitor YacG [Roseospira navarrensis]MQX36937.1 DNA gyrase inhibitor YacG [Roseospira navarrensis]
MPSNDSDDAGASAKTVAARLTAAACPVCGKATTARYRPFCSKRCADVDLSRWLGGGYVVPGHEPADPDAMADALRDADTTRED